MKYLFSIILIMVLFSCKKDKAAAAVVDNPSATPTPTTNPNQQTTSDIGINITNMAGSIILQIAKDTIYKASNPKYRSVYGDTFSVTKFRYYISNIRLKKTDGSYYREIESYRIIDASDSSNTCKFSLKNVPFGSYNAIELTIGVDSLRNFSGAQTGALDPVNDMYWSWNQGYIFLKFDAYTSSIPSSGVHNVEYHVGGFSGSGNNIKKISLLLPANLVVDQVPSKIYLKADALECLKTPATISFSALNTAINPASAKPIADNYADMFSVSAVTH